MAAAIVLSVIGNLIKAISDEEKLQVELLHFHQQIRSILDDLATATEFVDIVYDLEDAIDEFVVSSVILSKRNCAYRTLLSRKARRDLRRHLEVLCDRLKLMGETTLEVCFSNKLKGQWSTKQDQWSKRQDQFVGREEDLKRLTSGSGSTTGVGVIAIVGMGGLGKTTLAKQVYSQSRNQFERFGWLSLSNKVELKTVLQELMLQLTMETREKVVAMSELDLLLQLHKIQLESKCLIVVDDVWSTDAWINLQIAFPSKQPGKLLLTTRIREVGHMVVAANSGILHALDFFTEDESWDLIKALHPGIQTDASMELIARRIATKCNGLPVAINLLGERLGRFHSLAEWAALDQDIVLDKLKGDGIHQLLALSLTDLPVNLRHCLLYLALFLENSYIDADKLYRLWIAEGLVAQSSYGASAETLIGIADRYLRELESRGLVQVDEDEISRVRKLRSCRLHSTIRDMSLLRAKEENFLTVMDLRHGKQSTPTMTGQVRRLAAHLRGNKGGRSISFGQGKFDKMRSLLLLDTCPSKHNSSQEGSLCMPKSKLLRVLHLDGVDFGVGKYPKHIEKLVLLRYLSLRNCYLEELPPSISKLLNLQTLDLRVREGCLMTMHNVLRKMGRMKHLYLPQLFRVHNDEKLRLDTLTELETLENFNSKLCFAEDLLQLINLRFLKASIYENLEDLAATIKCINMTSNNLCEASLDIRSFHCHAKGKQAAIQKLFLCNALNTLYLEGYLGKLPEIVSSSLLSVMVFSKSGFDQDPMPLLGKLPNLRALGLYNYAFLGKQIVCPTMSFSELSHLKLSTLPNLENLIVEEGTMPKLSALTVEKCENLKLHPTQLEFLKNLKQIKISGTADAFEELQVRGEPLQDDTQYDVFCKYSMY